MNKALDSLISKDAEKAVLGAMMVNIDDHVGIPRAAAIISPEMFFTTDHQLICQAILDVYDETKTGDPILVANNLNAKQELARVGGADYLYELQAPIVEIENIEFYANIVHDLYTRRQMVKAASKITSLCHDENLEIQEVRDQAQNAISDFNIKHRNATEKIPKVLQNAVNTAETAYKKEGRLVGQSTGHPTLDDFTLGLQEDSVYIIAARPSKGKTAFVLNTTYNLAQKSNKPVLFFSLEMSNEALGARMLSTISMIPFKRIVTGTLEQEEWQRLIKAVAILEKANIAFNDDRTLNVDSILAETRRVYHENGGLALLVIDYLQLMNVKQKSPYTNREQDVSYMSRQLKRISGELHIPVIACAQLSRESERRQSKEPQLSDLRDSGAIEQDADFVAFLHGETDTTDTSIEMELLVKKNRNGPQGIIPYRFNRDIFLFEEAI